MMFVILPKDRDTAGHQLKPSKHNADQQKHTSNDCELCVQ